MKKFLSILLTLCLMLTVVAVPLPAIAETSNTFVQDFQNYKTTTYLDYSGRVIATDDPAVDGNRVIKFDNNGIPYHNAKKSLDKNWTYTKDENGNFTQVPAANVDAANKYDSYYHYSAAKADFDSDSQNSVTYDKNGKKVCDFISMEAYNAIELCTLKVSTTYRITINYKRENLDNELYVQPITWSNKINNRNTMYVDDTYERVTINKGGSDETWQTATTYVTTPADLVDSPANTATAPGNGNFLRLVLFTGEVVANNVVYFDNITVEECKGSVNYVIPENATLNGVTNDTVEVKYCGDDVVDWPTVKVADGYESAGWTDAYGVAVTTPELGGTYYFGVKKAVEKVTVTLYRGGTTDEYKKEETVPKGSYYTLPDTEFTDTSWWSNSFANRADRFIGYEGEEVVVEDDVTFYTAETYAKDTGASAYNNWTVVDDTEEGITYLRKTMKDTDTATAWAHGNGTRLCTRLGVVEDGNTYRISVTYKATTNIPLEFVMAISAITNPGDAMRNYLEEAKVFHTISKNTDGWETVTYYITADTPAKVTENTNGLDDTKDVDKYCALYLMVNKENGAHNVDIAINKTEVVDLGKVVEAKGASVLTKENEAIAESQSIRYYFDYATNEKGDGTKIMVGGTAYPVIERGFIYTNGAITHYAKENVKTGNEGYYIYDKGTPNAGFAAENFMMWLATAKKSANKNKLDYGGVNGEALKKNWKLKDDTVTFSIYTDKIYNEYYDVKIMARGYVIFEADGVQHIVYSETINRSVNGIKNAIGTGNNGEHVE